MKDDKEWFCDSIQTYQNSMYTLAIGILKNEDDAQDVIQDTILKAYSNLDSLRNRNKFKQWVMQILANTAYELLRKRKPTSDIDEQWDLQEPEKGIDISTKLTLRETVDSLPVLYRTVIILFYYENMSVKEIAVVTNTQPVTVRQQLLRARKLLKERLSKEILEL